MRAFGYRMIHSLDEAVAAAAQPETLLLAGGTSLLDLVKIEVFQPAQVADVAGLDLRSIDADAKGVRVGALVTNTALAEHAEIRKRFPVLAEAILSGASPQLRNMATVGGNLLQRTRCSYFRDLGTPCNKREPAAGCSAIGGYTRMHAVLGTSDKCIATHPSDMCVALAALGAEVHARGPAGERVIPFSEFHLLPADHPEREFALQPGEIITSIFIPDGPYAARSQYVKVRDRASYAFALASAAAALHLEGNVIKAARLALGGVGTRPWRSLPAEQSLLGQPAEESAFEKAAALALEGAKTQKHNEYKVELGKRVAVRALTLAAAQEKP